MGRWDWGGTSNLSEKNQGARLSGSLKIYIPLNHIKTLISQDLQQSSGWDLDDEDEHRLSEASDNMKAVMMLASVVRECLSWCCSYKYPECVGDERGSGGGRCIRWSCVPGSQTKTQRRGFHQSQPLIHSLVLPRTTAGLTAGMQSIFGILRKHLSDLHFLHWRVFGWVPLGGWAAFQNVQSGASSCRKTDNQFFHWTLQNVFYFPNQNKEGRR